MLRASYLAGTAFTKSYVGYVHAVAHSLGGQYGIPHGLANSVLLPIVLEAYGNAAHKKLAHLARITKLFFFPGRYHRSQCFYRTYPKNERFHEHTDDPRRYP